ncbi:MAG: ABC transporter substrate-binding protein [Candidatus Freyarchaeota archaeon]
MLTPHGSDIQLISEKLFLKSEYAKKYNIVDIRWMPVGAALWADTIRKSGDIDIGWGGGPVLFDVIHREGLLAPLTSEEAKKALVEIPDEIMGAPLKRYEDGKVMWVASAIASFGFTINKEYLEDEHLPMPTKWADLANETYAVTLPSQSVATADATKSTSNTRMFEIILQTHGWEKGWKLLTLMAANAKIFDASESVRDAVIMGAVGVGTTIDFYGYTAQLENPEACKYILPKDGTIVNGDPIALLATSKHKEAAQAFIAWVISTEGQIAWLDPKINRLPVNPKVFDTPAGQGRPDLKEIYEETLKAMVIEFSDELATSYEYSLMYFFHATLVRAKMKLQDVWMRLVEAKLTGKITQATFSELVDKLSNPLLFEFTDPTTGKRVTFTQEYAQSINEKIKTDPTFKTHIVSEWLSAAEARYESVLAELKGLGV